MSKRSKLTDEERKAKHREYSRKWRANNQDKARAYDHAYYHAHKDRKKQTMRESHVLRTYGITLDQKDHLFAAQGFRCAICSSDTPGSKMDWHIDHCHDTEAVRGILCHHCNLMLGNARDNPATLLAAVDYLRKHNVGGH